MSRPHSFVGLLLVSLVLGGCEDPPKKTESEPVAARPPTPPSMPPETLKGPPDLVIDNIGPKVGYTRINLQYPDGRGKLAAELAQVKSQFALDGIRLRVDRKAQLEWVRTYLTELGSAGASRVIVQSETRKEYPTELRFVPDNRVSNPPACSVVAMILADRGTAVWKLGGGVAGKRPKGMAGPDLTMTGDTIERNAKACKGSDTLFVAAAPEIEWGLVYDLAASAQTLAGARFESRVLLSKQPVPGHRVDLPR